MLVGHKDKVQIFKHLLRRGALSHGYIFFGEDQVGKKTFALAFANLLERGKFEAPEGILSEAKEILPEAGSIGIDAMREAKRFLFEKPILSEYRILIVDNAHKLTSQAQNAILKISEEPPSSSLIIVISPTLDVLLPTLKSRLQKVYFPRVEESEIAKLLVERGVGAAEASKMAKAALGRPGRAIDALENEDFKRFSKMVGGFIRNRSGRKEMLQSLVEENDDSPGKDLIDAFVDHMIAELALHPQKYEKTLGALCDRLTKMADFTTNRRLQLEAALWDL